MSADDKMTLGERWKYLRLVQKRYLQASRSEQGRLLDEMVSVTGLHRKSLIRLMGSDLTRRPRRQQRGRSYGLDVRIALGIIWESCDHICAERLQPNLVWLANHLERYGELEVTPELLAKLATISISTVGRILARVQQDQPRLPRRGPEEANRATRQVPIQIIPWQERQPGHFEVDLVHHCGASSEGLYVHTLQMVDVATGWSERVAVLGRSWRVVADGFERTLRRLPFPILQVHSDNGNEFLNAHLLRFWEDAADPQLSRGRPYHKNDQRFVEQKNATLVRAYLGQQRLDSVLQTNALNDLYDQMWLYYNFFQPVMRLVEKTVADTVSAADVDSSAGVKAQQPPRIKRRFDQAQTPFERLCATQILSEQQENALRTLRDQTNPRQLRQTIYDTLATLPTLAAAVAGHTEDIFQTLNRPLWSALQPALWLPPSADTDESTTAAVAADNNDADVSQYFKVHSKEEDSPVTFSSDRTIPVR